jgi:hypothetical protein
MNRPDFSNYVLHFTSGRLPCCSEKIPAADPAAQIKKKMSALDRLLAILPQADDKDGCIRATPMPWSGAKACCFTESVWSSLPDHAKRYSPYGIGFEKNFIFACGGGPAFYVRADHYQKQRSHNATGGLSGFHPHFHSFVTPFWPKYASKKHRDKYYGKFNANGIDFSYEREWRLPHELTFKINKVKIVILKSHNDLASFPSWLLDQLKGKIVIMDVYDCIEKFWPTHRV